MYVYCCFHWQVSNETPSLNITMPDISTFLYYSFIPPSKGSNFADFFSSWSLTIKNVEVRGK